MEGNMDPFKVLIIGAGTTGLLIAQGLKKNNVEFAVFERTDEYTYQHRQRTWTMALHWGADYISENLPVELLAKLRLVEGDPWIELTGEQERYMPILNGKTGEVILNAPTATTRRGNREKLRKLFATGIDVHYGKTLVGIEDDGERVTAFFEDGTKATGNALVGCDSASSFVRDFVCPPGKGAAETMPVIPYNFTSKYTAEQARFIRNTCHPLIKVGPHPDQDTWYFIAPSDIKDPDDPTTWEFQLFLNLWSTTDKVPDTSAARLAHFKELAGAYCEPFRSASRWLKDDTFVPRDSIKHWPNTVRWDNHEGRITLAGDAAHPMAPYRGQGVNNGLQDASYYVSALTRFLSSRPSHPLRAAIDAYDAEVFKRGTHEIRISAEQGYFSTHFDVFTNGHTAKHGMNKINEEIATSITSGRSAAS